MAELHQLRLGLCASTSLLLSVLSSLAAGHLTRAEEAWRAGWALHGARHGRRCRERSGGGINCWSASHCGPSDALDAALMELHEVLASQPNRD